MAKKVVWILLSRKLLGVAVVAVGVAGGLFSLFKFNPVLAVTGSRLTWTLRFILDVMEFVWHGI